MPKTHAICKVYKYHGQVYDYIPEGFKVKRVTELNGLPCGILRKSRGILIDLLLVGYLVGAVLILRELPDRVQHVQIPDTFYVMNGKLNVDICNPSTNPMNAYVTIMDTNHNVLWSDCIEPGESVSVVEIPNNLASYIVEYKVKLFDYLDVKEEYIIVNSNYKEN